MNNVHWGPDWAGPAGGGPASLTSDWGIRGIWGLGRPEGGTYQACWLLLVVPVLATGRSSSSGVPLFWSLGFHIDRLHEGHLI